MELRLVLLLAAGCCALPPIQYQASSSDGSYSFNYETGSEGGKHSRKETRSAEGVVVGKFSYEDPNGKLRLVEYRADENGYSARGHVGPDGSPRAELPLYHLPEFKEEEASETTTETPEESDPSTEEPTTEKPESDVDKDLGFFVLGLGGKRRLEKPSDTGKLDTPPEEDKKHVPRVSPFAYYPVIHVPYVTSVKQLPRPIYATPFHHPVQFFPYAPQIHNPIIPAKSYFHSYQINHQ